MTNRSKLITGGLSLGTLGGGFALTNHLTTPSKPLSKTLSEKLEKDGFNVNVTDWTPILTSYNKLQDTTKTFKTTNAEEIDEETLKQKCADAFSKLDSDITNYRKARQWCVVEKTADKILEKANYKVLDSTGTDATDTEGKWEAKTTKLKKFPEGYPEIGNQMKGNKDNDIPILKKACTDLKIKELKTTDAEFNSKFELAKYWCSEEQNKS